MKLYSYFRSTSAWRVRTVLAFKGVEYEYVAVNLAPESLEQDVESYGSVNPMRQVPTLEWSEGGEIVRLTQSVAIVEYLEEAHPNPPLLPADPLRRAYVRRAVEIVNSGIQPLQNSKTVADVKRLGGDGAVQEWMKSAMTRGFRALESHARASGGKYSVGDQPTLADVYLVPQLYNARRFGVDITPFPTLTEIDERLSALPAFAAARPDVQPDAPRPDGGKGRDER